MALLVTGVAGFIGSNFVYYYLNQHPDSEMIGLDSLTYAGNLDNLSNLTVEQKQRFHFIKGDINDKVLLEKIYSQYDLDGIINFAAESHVDRSIHDPQIFLKTNILGTQNLLHVFKEHYDEEKGHKFLQVSTDEVYGTLGPTGLFSETTPLDPHSPYSASKTSGDLIVKAYHDTYGLYTLTTRCSNNYGPYQFPEKLIPLMINNALHHKELPVYGDGKQVRDWLYVSDHCRAIDQVFECGLSGEVYNIGGNNERENILIVQSVLKILREKTGDSAINEGLIKHVKDRLGHDRRYGIDASKIKKEMGWEPQVSFEQGIVLTIDWYLNHQEWTKSVISGEYLDFYQKNYFQ